MEYEIGQIDRKIKRGNQQKKRENCRMEDMSTANYAVARNQYYSLDCFSAISSIHSIQSYN